MIIVINKSKNVLTEILMDRRGLKIWGLEVRAMNISYQFTMVSKKFRPKPEEDLKPVFML